MILKEVYLSKVLIETKIKKLHHDKLEDSDHNLTRTSKSTPKVKRPTISNAYIEKNIFE